MEMHQVRYFLAVARTLNFTQAAEECNVSQPSLSRAIIKLEEELGGDLFRRERSLTHLTELGRMMQPLLQQTYDAAASAKTLATSYRKGGVAPLRLALSSTVDLRLLMGPLAGLMEALPGVELKFFRGSASDVALQVKAGDFELGLAGLLDEGWDRFKSWVLFACPLRLIVHRTHRLANSQSVILRDIANERLLGRPYCELSTRFSEILAQSGICQAPGDLLAADVDTLEMIRANLGVSIMPATTQRYDDLKSLPINDLELEAPTLLYSVAGRQHSPAAAALIQLVRSANWKQILASHEEKAQPD